MRGRDARPTGESCRAKPPEVRDRANLPSPFDAFDTSKKFLIEEAPARYGWKPREESSLRVLILSSSFGFVPSPLLSVLEGLATE